MRRYTGKESGEIMLEATIVMVITMLMLVWILGVGFLYYQKYTVRIATNDAAKKVATTYDMPNSDIVMGYVSIGDLKVRKIYASDSLDEDNRLRAESYVKYYLDQTSWKGTVKDVHVSLEHKKDGLGRSHIILTTECTFDTAFGLGLEVFGMSSEKTYKIKSYAESTSLSEYVSTVSTADLLTDGRLLGGTGFIEKTVKMINTFMKTCDQLSD